MKAVFVWIPMKSKIELRSQRQAVHIESVIFHTSGTTTLKSLQKEQKQQLKKRKTPYSHNFAVLLCHIS